MRANVDALHMLDTGTAMQAIYGPSPGIERRLIALPSQAVCISAMTRAELVYSLVGAAESPASVRVRKFLEIIKTLTWDAAAADRYAEIRHQLNSRGQAAGDKDVEIAAHAASAGAVLVTPDVARFREICAGLTLEDWSQT